MKYLLQLILIIIFIAAERHLSKVTKYNIDNNMPYNSGVFVVNEITGNKAEMMYKVRLVVIRIVVVATIISIFLINIHR
jgi:hypothetical protein